MTETSFGDQLQQLWRTRPARLPRQGRIAGVAAGFGHRYGVDPVLVRVALVVSTFFGGAGLVLYLAGWLLFPDPGEGTSMAESLTGSRRDSQSQTKTIVLIVALAIAVSALGPVGVGLGGSGLIGLALMLAAWWMLYLRAPEPPPLPPGNGGAEPLPGQGTTGYPGTAFPQSAPSPGGSHFTGLYTPYTQLPDRYVPDSPAQDTGTATPPDAGRASQAPGAASAQSPPTPDGPSGGAVAASGGSTPDGTAEAGEALGATSGPKLTKGTGTPASTGPHPGSSAPVDRAAGSTGVPAGSARPTPGTGSAGPTTDSPASTTGSRTVSGAPPRHVPGSGSATIDMNKTAGPTAEGVPPSWDPLGVAPLAWDLPEPAATGAVAVTAEKRPQSRFTPIVLGLAVLAAAGAGAAAAAGAEWMTAARIGACALAVIGLGLMLGAFRRRGHGLLAVTAPLAAFVILAAAVSPIDFQGAIVGERTWAPAAATEIRPEYSVTMGQGTLDLRGIELTGDTAVDLSVHMGEAVVLVPESMNVRTECTVRMGEANCPDGLTGPGAEAPVLDLNLQVQMGSAEVRRG